MSGRIRRMGTDSGRCGCGVGVFRGIVKVDDVYGCERGEGGGYRSGGRRGVEERARRGVGRLEGGEWKEDGMVASSPSNEWDLSASDHRPSAIFVTMTQARL